MLTRTTAIVVVLVAAVAVAAGLTLGWPRWSASQPALNVAPPAAPAATQENARAEVALDTRRQQLIGVRTLKVQRAAMSPEIRAAGTVAADETRQAEINTRVDGWIRDLSADYTGRPVRRGEPLFTLYSPDVIATQNEYLLALRGQSHDSHDSQPNLEGYADRLVTAARERLLRLDMAPEEIDQLRDSGRPTETITFRSPVSGIVVEKTAVRGMRVMAGQTLFRVADLSSVWVEAEIYERDLGAVRIGASATVEIQAYPDRRFAGRVSYISPTVSPETRTARARITLANPGGLLKPNMLATVLLQTRPSNALVLPVDAVVDTGQQQLVFLAEGDGRFTPTNVRVGRRTAGEVEILSGLNEGDEVAASATFFLDSESQLRGALQGYQPSSAAPTSTAAAPALGVTFRTDPDPPHTGDNTVIVTLTDPSGQPVADAEVAVQFFMAAMPAMNMPAVRSETRLLPAGAGVYRGTGQLMTPGTWDVTVMATKDGTPLVTRRFSAAAR
jgi:Cu(I)/Ag(I) efflux system membrane fusion protein/cobalt-zinc-cadmium efflux system membrane fusion protein